MCINVSFEIFDKYTFKYYKTLFVKYLFTETIIHNTKDSAEIAAVT